MGSKFKSHERPTEITTESGYRLVSDTGHGIFAVKVIFPFTGEAFGPRPDAEGLFTSLRTLIKSCLKYRGIPRFHILEVLRGAASLGLPIRGVDSTACVAAFVEKLEEGFDKDNPPFLIVHAFETQD